MILTNMNNKIEKFQFTPLREGRRFLDLLICLICYFNSRPSARGDTLTAEYNPIENYISIHAPPRGATQALQNQITAHTFQFTPLREGRR